MNALDASSLGLSCPANRWPKPGELWRLVAVASWQNLFVSLDTVLLVSSAKRSLRSSNRQIVARRPLNPLNMKLKQPKCLPLSLTTTNKRLSLLGTANQAAGRPGEPSRTVGRVDGRSFMFCLDATRDWPSQLDRRVLVSRLRKRVALCKQRRRRLCLALPVCKTTQNNNNNKQRRPRRRRLNDRSTIRSS